MCNRAERGQTDKVLRLFDARIAAPFNDGPLVVHPRDPGTVIRRVEGALQLDQMTWGFPVALASKRDPAKKNKPKPVNNARFDKLGGFWKRWAADPAHRCLIPTARYAEAVGEPGRMTETWLSLKSQEIFAWAGLWTDSAEWGLAYTGVMTANAPELAHIHDRSPVILAPADWNVWLTEPLDALYRFDRPWPAQDVAVEHTATPWTRRPSSPRLL